MNHEFTSQGPITADLRIAGGTLDVSTGQTGNITVSVEPADSSPASQEAAQQTQVALDGTHLIVHGPFGKGWAIFRNPKLRIRAELPAQSTLRVKAASADVTCQGVYHEVVAHTASGNLQLDQVSKDVSINSASGALRVRSVGGDLSANTASGDVAVEHAAGAVNLKSASGDLEIGRAGADVRAKTASGDVQVGVASRGEVRVHTASGDVAVGVAAGTGVWLDLNTASGKTTSDLSGTEGGAAPAGGAALTVKVRTASGDIALRRVAAVE